MALPCGHALCEGCFGRIPGGALLVDGQSVGAAPRPAEDARASEAQDRDATRQRHAEADGAAARREAVERSRREAAEERERRAAVERSRREAAEERERQREAAAARAEEVQCVICQETIRGGDQRRPCAHVFHRACLQRWLPEHRSCPVCRTPVSAESAPAPERGRADAARDAADARVLEAVERSRREAERARAELRAARDEAARREAARAREAAAARARAAFHVGQRVEARTSTRSNQWFPAKITAVNGGRLYDILYDDGGISRGKCESLIRRYTGCGPAAPPPRPACRVCGGNFPHPACSGCGTPGARAAATTAQPGHSSPQPGGRRTDGLISTDEIAGCWVCMCFPFGFTAIFSKEVPGPDSIKHAGLILNPVFWPFEEHRIRHPGTNGFYKVGEPQDVDQYSSKDCVCNGLACSMKLC